MKGVINPLSQRGADAVRLGQVLNAGLRQLFQSTELPQQGLTTLGAVSYTHLDVYKRQGVRAYPRD